METNLGRGSGEQRRGEQSCTKQVGKVGFVEPKGRCGVLPWVDSTYFWFKKRKQNQAQCLAVSLNGLCV